MKVRLLPLLVILSLIACIPVGSIAQTATASETADISAQTEALLSYQDAITTTYLRTHLTIFAADSMEGRETAMPGQKKAARYLADQYRKLGLKPVGDNDSYLQEFKLSAERSDSIAFTTLKTGNEGIDSKTLSESVSSKEKTANFIRRFGGSQQIEGEIVYAGFGIQNEALGIDHFDGINVKGKWVMIFEDLPQVIEGDSLFTDRRQFAQAWLGNILQQGAAGILVIPNVTEAEFQKEAQANGAEYGEPTGMQLAYLAEQQSGPAWSYNAIRPSHAAEVLEFDGDAGGLQAEKEKLIWNIKSFNPKETGYGLKQIPYTQKVTLETENVVALMEGADPQLKDEVVVLSAHYDHVGIGTPDSTGDAIYNGANDDGSGTIGILAAARAFAKAKENGVQPRRSVLFLSVSGEEKGLLGSRYYSDHPIFPMEKTVANINTDMIGRVDPKHQQSGIGEYIYIIGGDIISSDMDSLLKAGNKRSGNLELDMRYNDLDDPNQFYRRSDHWNFGRFGVPFVFFFNGVHEDYHQPSDEVDKINFNLLTETVQTMYATTVMVANADSAPKVDNQEFIEITKEN